MAGNTEAAKRAHEAVLARDSAHVLTDANGDDRMLSTDAAFAGVDVEVNAYTEEQHPERMGYRRTYAFVWADDRTLVYDGCTCAHGGMPVRKTYPCPELIRDLVEDFFDGVTVKSPHGFNRAHQH